MLIDRRYFRYFDWISFSITILLLSFGLLFVFSSTYTPEKPFSIFFKKQLFGAITGLFIYLFFSFKDLRNLSRFGFFLYFFILVLLTYTYLAGFVGMGAKRWLSLYFFKFQPSELVKLFLPSFLAFYFLEQDLPKYHKKFNPKSKDFLFPAIILFISFLLIFKQPDLGTALIILFTGLILFRVIGLKNKFFFILILSCAISTPIIWKILKPYHQKRILVLLGGGEAQKDRYQIEQSKIAIGSGGIFGKGVLKGTQNKLAFLPENHTDFIFSVICEEWGFVGAIFILLLFFLLFTRITLIILQIKNLFDQIIAVGLLTHLILSVVINIGMTVGILPIVGIPLPLFSYGITHLWICMASLGWINNIAIRRYAHY
ncbi:MAG: rod shape-determining protein RodA [bacterium]